MRTPSMTSHQIVLVTHSLTLCPTWLHKGGKGELKGHAWKVWGYDNVSSSSARDNNTNAHRAHTQPAGQSSSTASARVLLSAAAGQCTVLHTTHTHTVHMCAAVVVASRLCLLQHQLVGEDELILAHSLANDQRGLR